MSDGDSSLFNYQKPLQGLGPPPMIPFEFEVTEARSDTGNELSQERILEL